MTWKKMIVGLKIMKKVQKAYNRDNNGYLIKKLNLFLVGPKIIKRVQKSYDRDSNGHLRKEINLFTNKK